MTIDGSDSLVPVKRKNHNSPAGKRIRENLFSRDMTILDCLNWFSCTNILKGLTRKLSFLYDIGVEITSLNFLFTILNSSHYYTLCVLLSLKLLFVKGTSKPWLYQDQTAFHLLH